MIKVCGPTIQPQKTNREYGNFTNNSKYIRVAMDEDVDRGTTNGQSSCRLVFWTADLSCCSVTSGSADLLTLERNKHLHS